jgi:hypothetical protein
MVILSWRDGRADIQETEEPEESTEWVFRLAEDDRRLVRAVIIEERTLEDDDDWGGASLFVRDIICFQGFEGYPPYWYQEAAPRSDAPGEPPKKARKK